MTAPYGTTPPDGNIPPQGGTQSPTGASDPGGAGYQGGYPGGSYPGQADYALQDLNGTTDPNDLSRPYYGATFPIAVKRFFKKYATFSGRASRSEFWWSVLTTMLITIIPTIIFYVGLFQSIAWRTANGEVLTGYVDTYGNPAVVYPGLAEAPSASVMIVGLILMLVVFLALVVPMLAITWRRLHDANFSGAFWLLSLVGLGIVVLILTLLQSKAEGRRFDSPSVV